MATRIVSALLIVGVLAMVYGCAVSRDPGVAGIYQTWDDVIDRWIGKQKTELYYELGPPNLHPKELDDGTIEMVWDMTIDRMPGQADDYRSLPLYSGVNCQLVFVSNREGMITAGRRIGCD